MFKNVSSQVVTLYVIDSATGLPKTGDSANQVFYVSKDDGTVTAISSNSGVPTEIDSTNAKGLYKISLSQSETNGDKLLFSGKSSTSGIVVVPTVIYTTPPSFTGLTITSGGVTLADGVSHGGTLGSSTATLAISRLNVTSQTSNTDALTLLGNGSGSGLRSTGGAAVTSTSAGAGAYFTGGASSSTSGGGAGLGLYAIGGAGSASNNGAAHGAEFQGGGTTTVSGAYGLEVIGSGNLPGGAFIGAGTGAGMKLTGGATGNAFDLVGGATSGDGFHITTTSGHGFNVVATGTAMDAMHLVGAAASSGNAGGHGINSTGGASTTSSGGTAGVGMNLLGGAGSASTNGAGDGMKSTGGGTTTVSGGNGVTFAKTGSVNDFNATSTPLTLAKTTNITGFNDIAASAIVSSGAITTSGGAVSTVTTVTTTTTATNLTNAPTAGDFTATMKTSIGTAVAASAVASVTGNVGGNVTGSVGSVASGGITNASLATDTGFKSIRSNTAQAGGSTTITLDASASATNSYYVNDLIVTTGGTGAGQAKFCTAYVGSTKVATVDSAWATNPDSSTTFAILPFSSVPGASAPSAATIATTIWQDLLSGSDFTTTGSIGKLLHDDIDAAISSRGTSTLTQTQVTGGAYALNSSSFAFASAFDFTTTQKTSLNSATPSVTVSDKTGFSLANGSIVTATFGTCDFTSTMKTSLGTAVGTAQTGDSYPIVNSGTFGNSALNTAIAALPAGILDLTNGIETGLTPRGAIRLIVAANAGKLSGAATTTVTVRNAVADSKARITATVDSDGNRSAITTDVT